MSSASRVALEQLRSKYGEMLSMRLAHDAGVDSEAQARQRMAKLASQFPGALREIDELELGIIRDRIGQLDAALRGDIAVERWMEALGLFHTLARGALRAKRWLAGRKTVDRATVLEYEDEVAGLGPGEAARSEVGESVASDPVASDPVASDPVASDPVPSDPVASDPLASDPLAWGSDLARIAAPPRGRVMDLVFARVARTLGTTEVEARYLVFGPPRRSRR